MHDSRFIFKGYDMHRRSKTITFHYGLEQEGKLINFIENITLPAGLGNWDVLPPRLAVSVLESLLLILGISYWKTYCPRTIVLESMELTRDQANFWNTVYTKGLGEFFYNNNIDFRGLVRFPYSISAKNPHPLRISLKKRALVLLGGGKDSIVSAELMRAQKKPFVLFTLNQHPLQRTLIALMKKKSFLVERILDKKLFSLNHKNAYNGHVPATAIYSFTALLAALLYDFRDIVVSCERSANVGNVAYRGEVVNHQWSKSREFENMLRDYVARFMTPSLNYISPLRRFSELDITEIFSHHAKYFSAFSSCNANFSITKPAAKKWCGRCAKCAFVYVALAAYIPKPTVVGIFGKNMLADKSLLPLYKELLGLQNFKPFECVGTPEETREALSLIIKRGEFDNDIVINQLRYAA